MIYNFNTCSVHGLVFTAFSAHAHGCVYGHFT
eukprot:SAG31_NODE_22888_length_516_cov_0.623501_2_plen_31_part_01